MRRRPRIAAAIEFKQRTAEAHYTQARALHEVGQAVLRIEDAVDRLEKMLAAHVTS